MKLVWLLNVILPVIAEAEGKKREVVTGWTVLLSDILSSDPEIELTVFYPQHDSRENIKGRAGNLDYVGFYEAAVPELSYNPDMTERIKRELDRIKPDIVHIWGSEFVHTLSMVRAYNRPDRTLISIQGLIYSWGLIYNSGLPEKIVKRHTFRDLLRKDSIEEQKQKFLKRGECENEALHEVSHVIGRTRWDYEAVLKVNPSLTYHHGGEILRKEFYEASSEIKDGIRTGVWSAVNAERHRIFMSQSYYPVKGIHFALEAVYRIKKIFPDIVLAVTGKDMRPGSFKEIIKQDSYGKYICELIRKYRLQDNIEFLGEKDPAGMIEQYRKCSLFLLPSVMENSSNSLGEAMILGVPCVAAATGGTPDMMDKDEGWLYDRDMDIMTAHIRTVLDMVDREKDGEDTGLIKITEKAASHAAACYDVEKNKEAYLTVYKEMLTQG